MVFAFNESLCSLWQTPAYVTLRRVAETGNCCRPDHYLISDLNSITWHSEQSNTHTTGMTACQYVKNTCLEVTATKTLSIPDIQKGFRINLWKCMNMFHEIIGICYLQCHHQNMAKTNK